MLSRSNKITGYAMRAGSRYLVPAIPIILTLLASCMWPSIVPSLAMLLNVEPQTNWAYLSINSQCHVNMTWVNRGGCHFIISKLEESLQLLLQDRMIVRMCMLGSGRLVLTAEQEETLPLQNLLQSPQSTLTTWHEHDDNGNNYNGRNNRNNNNKGNKNNNNDNNEDNDIGASDAISMMMSPQNPSIGIHPKQQYSLGSMKARMCMLGWRKDWHCWKDRYRSQMVTSQFFITVTRHCTVTRYFRSGTHVCSWYEHTK